MIEEIYCDHCGELIDSVEESFVDGSDFYCCEDCMIAGQDEDILND
jgi:ribosome-binding protein aMBF1 (putative translation factor)